MKKLLLLLIIPAILLSLMFVTVSNEAFAQKEGFDVRGDYKAEIVFGNFSLANGRRLFTLSVTLDNDFIDQIEEEVIFDKDSLFSYLSAIMIAIRFEPEVDDRGRIIGKQLYESATDLQISEGNDGYEVYNPQYESVDTFFFREIYNRQKTFFAGAEGNNQLIDILLMQLSLHGLSRDEIALGYHYGTPYKIITTDAERSYFDTNSRIYVHEFQMNLDNADREILIMQRVPNATNWYLLAILITVPFVIAPILIGIYVKRKEKQRSEY